MLWRPIKYSGDTGPAHTLFARGLDLDSFFPQHIHDCFVRRNRDSFSRTGELQLKGRLLALTNWLRAREILKVNSFVWPPATGRDSTDSVHEGLWTAQIQVTAGVSIVKCAFEGLFDVIALQPAQELAGIPKWATFNFFPERSVML